MEDESEGIKAKPSAKAPSSNAQLRSRGLFNNPHPAFVVHDSLHLVTALNSWRDHPGSFAHRLLECGPKKIALQVVRASCSRLARRSLITVVTGERKKILESHNTTAPVSLSFTRYSINVPTTPSPYYNRATAYRLLAQPCFSSRSSRRPSSCIPRTSALSSVRTFIRSFCRRRKDRVQENTPSCVYWTRSTSQMAK